MRSLGYRTDLMVLRPTAEVLRREGYTVVRSPAEPTYHGGNLTVFEEPPRAGDEERWPALAESGRGSGYGAFLDGRLVADLGIYHDGDVARYQSVVTHPDFRRRGVCGTLVHGASRLVLESTGARRLVMCAASDEPAEGIYRSVGFEKVEEQAGLCWRPH